MSYQTNHWYIILESKELKQKPIGVKRMNEKLVLWRTAEGEVCCTVDKCSHRGASLCLGDCINNHIQCPFHGLEFDKTGKCMVIPANGKNEPVDERFNIKSYATHEEHNFIWIFWGDKEKITGKPQFFDNLEDLYYTSAADHWNTHYSRAIENQLDVAHLPFVHRKTIGKGNKTLVDGPVVTWKDEEQMYMYVYNRIDDGSKAKKPSELTPKGEGAQRIEFIFPNAWQNYLLKNMRIVVAFVPIDDENTLFYIRFYQGFVKIPILRTILNKLFMPYNFKILHEDRRVVTTQEPKISRLRSDENLFQADMPIIEYRKRVEKDNL